MLSGVQPFAYPLQPTTGAAATETSAPPLAPMPHRWVPVWQDLLTRAVEEPGLLLEAYHRFHGFSLGNCFAALLQCQARGLETGPIHTFVGWQKLGRRVKAGERALLLCMPLTRRPRNGTDGPAREPALRQPRDDGAGDGASNGATEPAAGDPDAREAVTIFVWKARWFVLAQTEPVDGTALPENGLEAAGLGVWEEATALQQLGITRLPFDIFDGNTLGFAHGRSVALSPVAPLPHKTLFHEIAHVVLGHTQCGDLRDGPALSRALIEAEAESTALLLLAAFDLPGQEYCRGYIQSWLQGEGIPESSARRIFGAAERILRAGLPQASARDAHEAGQEGETRTEAAAPGGVAWESAGGIGLALPQALEPDACLAGNAETCAPPRTEAGSGPLPAGALHDGQQQAWRLFDRLGLLYGVLHPGDLDEQRGIARAMRYLEARCPDDARTLRELLVEASRRLKAARSCLETALEGLPPPEASTEPEANPPHPGDGPPIPEPVPEVEPVSEVPLSLPGLSVPQTAPARQAVRQQIHQDREREKQRFLALAGQRGLPVGRKASRPMLRALALYLRIPLESRRDLSARQWALAAEGLETGELNWEAPNG